MVVVVRVMEASRLEPVPCQCMRKAQQDKIKKRTDKILSVGFPPLAYHDRKPCSAALKTMLVFRNDSAAFGNEGKLSQRHSSRLGIA